MARIRSIKPEFWIDEKIVDLTAFARLLFIALWNFADDQGYVDDKPRRIKMQVFPGDDLDVEALLGELLSAGLLVRYDSPVGPVLYVRNWEKHQKVDRPSAPRFDADTLVLRPPFVKRAESSQVEPSREDSSNARESSPASVDAEGKGSGSGSGRDLDLEGKARVAPRRDGAEPSLSVTQRAKRITDSYSAAEPMSKWPAINGIVIKAIKAERWSDDQIAAALLRMAGEGRPVTVDALRVELDGMPARASPNGRTSTAQERAEAALAAGRVVQQAFDRKEITA